MDKSVLIVDDQVVIINALETFLEINGYHVFREQNPENVISSIKDNNPDIVLMDISMPEIDGVALLRQITEEKLNTSVVMMTAFSSIDRVTQCREFGAIDYIVKPFADMDEILYIIDSVVARLKRWEKALQYSGNSS